jgi:VIT1/CCC1 family predicted Fe2+/Mn2+ transporter
MIGRRTGAGGRREVERSAKRWREMLATEREAAALYDGLADAETGERAEILRELAAVERRHAAHWESRLREAGLEVPPPSNRPGMRTRLLTGTAQRMSIDTVLPLIERAERTDAGIYDADPDAAEGMAEDERGHARTLASLRSGGSGREPAGAKGRVARRESWHHSDRSGALRAGIFGVSDGLVSNTALVMGFTGSGLSRSAVLLAGVAGLLAGSFSMAAGEYVSMSGQREMFEREISIEAAELEEKPHEELEELVLLYRAKGLPADQARELAETLMADKTVALDTLVREELGLDPDALGSPWAAAFSSLLTFALGAFVVVIPYLFAGGTGAFLAAVIMALVAMLVVGAVIGVVNGRSAVRSGLRQLIAGALAAGITFAVGHLLGATVS